MVSCILPYYIHRQIYRCMNIYIQKYILTHYILYIFIHILIARTYIHTYIATLFQQHLRLRLRRIVFLPVAFLPFTFYFFLIGLVQYGRAAEECLFFENLFSMFPSRLGSLSTITIIFLHYR